MINHAISHDENLALNKSLWFLECSCDMTGSKGVSCSGYGDCVCKVGYSGQKCSGCTSGYFSSNGLCSGKVQSLL